MKFVALFEDNPAAGPDVRRLHMAAHLAFLEKHAGKVTAAGPLQAGDGQGAGGLWLVEARRPKRPRSMRWSSRIRSGRRACASRFASSRGSRFLPTAAA